MVGEQRSARDALAAALERIGRHDAAIGAFTKVLVEQAEQDATAADRAGPVGPLRGVPIGVKELFDIAGGEVTYGSDVMAGRRPPVDSEVVARLRRAGAVVVGSTRTHEFGWGITTQHATRGSTRNPWALERVPGGSSGGSAAAVAAGLVPLAVGTDTGGSIRIPSAFCGVIGLKTTLGRIPRTGSVPLAPSFDTPGFIARTSSLLAAALFATAAPDPADAATLGTPPIQRAVRPPASLRFAVPGSLLAGPLTPPVSGALAAVVEALLQLGATRVDVEAPDASRLLEIFVPFQMAEALHVHAAVLETFPAHAERYGADVRQRLEMAQDVAVDDYLAARTRADDVRARVALALTEADVLVTPVGTCGPSTTDHPDEAQLDGRAVPLRAAIMPYTVLQNLAGLPSVTVPVGRDGDGLPIGIQLTGPPWSEPELLAVSAALEEVGLVAVTTPPGFAD